MCCDNKFIFCLSLFLLSTYTLVLCHNGEEHASKSAGGKIEGCTGGYKFPDGCNSLLDDQGNMLATTPENPCTYEVQWSADKGQSIHVTVITKLKDASDRWVGIGFNKDHSTMEGLLDIVLGNTKTSEIKDYHVSGHAVPEEDGTQNLENTKMNVSNNVAIVKFDRKLDTGDDSDADLSSTCVYFIYPTGGGTIDTEGKLVKHAVTPMSQEVCVCDVGKGGTAGLVGPTKIYISLSIVLGFLASIILYY